MHVGINRPVEAGRQFPRRAYGLFAGIKLFLIPIFAVVPSVYGKTGEIIL